jgi:dUTP pyrophosphatase
MEAKQAKAHAGDCGVDLFMSELERPSGAVVSQVTVHTGVHVAAFDESGRPTGCLLYPRSSISKTHLTLANSVGVIDAGYRGEVMAKMNVHRGTGRSVDWNDKDLRLVQIVLPSMRAPLVEFVDSLDALGVPPDSRGAGGFGSTSVST